MRPPSLRRALAAALVAAAALPAAAAADSTVTYAPPRLSFFNEDFTTKNTLTVDIQRNQVHFYDEGDPYGFRYSPQCSPGKLNDQSNAVEVFCPTANLQELDVDLGPNEDRAVIKVPFKVSASGASGADQITTGALDDLLIGDQGNDVLDGAGGNDELQGGDGSDTLRGGPGDDRLRARDGQKDIVECGDGTDTAIVDTADQVDAACEDVQRQFVSGTATAADDKKPPSLRAGALTTQRPGAIRVAGRSSEEGILGASGFLELSSGLRPIKPVQIGVDVAGGGAQLVLKLTKADLRAIRRDLRRKRKVYARINVVATDRAGNSSRPRAMKIRIKR